MWLEYSLLELYFYEEKICNPSLSSQYFYIIPLGVTSVAKLNRQNIPFYHFACKKNNIQPFLYSPLLQYHYSTILVSAGSVAKLNCQKIPFNIYVFKNNIQSFLYLPIITLSLKHNSFKCKQYF